ncbi:MAG TPA: U32 family peptidase [Bryobacteraceae bacterium]|nr:U32 family peptidase [Bryobacteraceae bacterium]
MSPVGYWPQLRAAIEAGADAVYFGLKHFTARAKVGFSLEELPEVMRTLHRRGVRGYVTFNTLIFEHELDEAARVGAAIVEAGADALIVQDLGILRLLRGIAPDVELHASTQMSITDAEGVRFAQAFGADRVTLARELSLAEVRTIREQTGCPIEMFVHGALCVAYSGQCFSSEAWGGRSANRGQCAQACRLPYDLMVDGAQQPLGDARYLLSPGDLYTLREIPEIVASGVSALKIEGRYKDAEYVALTTQAYRKAVDDAWAGAARPVRPEAELLLEQVYSRGLGPYFVTGTNHQKVVQGRAPRHRGVLMGRVVETCVDSVQVELLEADTIAPLKEGDGLVFDAADWRSPGEDEEGGRVYEVTRRGRRVELRFGNRAVRFERIRAGDLVWRTDDPNVTQAARPFTEATSPVQRQTVCVRVTAREAAVLVAEWTLGDVRVVVKSDAVLGVAQNRAISIEMVQEQFGRLGGTAYVLGEVSFDVEGSPFAPVSMLNQMRREAVERLAELQGARRGRVIAAGYSFSSAGKSPATISPVLPELHLLVRTGEQLEAAIEARPASITLDYLDLYGLRPSIQKVKASGIVARVAGPRVLKPGEAKILNFLLSLECEILVRSTGILQALEGREHPALIGDFSLNAANSLSAMEYLKRVTRLAPTHDLNAAQVAELARDAGAENIEAIAYQHLPVFHTEHCVFCRFLSEGTSYKDCGRPCEKHRVDLRDHAGRSHPVMADVGCRNTVFGAEAQEASSHLELWRAAGIRHFRLEFAHESEKQVKEVARLFDLALRGEPIAAGLGRALKTIAPEGTTQGSLFVPPDYRSLPILQ